MIRHKNTIMFESDGSINKELVKDISLATESNIIGKLLNTLKRVDNDNFAIELDNTIQHLARLLGIKDSVNIFLAESEHEFNTNVKATMNQGSISDIAEMVSKAFYSLNQGMKENEELDIIYRINKIDLFISIEHVKECAHSEEDSEEFLKEIVASIVYELYVASNIMFTVVKHNEDAATLNLIYYDGFTSSIRITDYNDDIDHSKLVTTAQTMILALKNQSKAGSFAMEHVPDLLGNPIWDAYISLTNSYNLRTTIDNIVRKHSERVEVEPQIAYLHMKRHYELVDQLAMSLRRLNRIGIKVLDTGMTKTLDDLLKGIIRNTKIKMSNATREEENEINNSEPSVEFHNTDNIKDIIESDNRIIAEDVFFGKSGRIDAGLREVEKQFREIAEIAVDTGDYKFNGNQEVDRRLSRIKTIVQKMFNMDIDLFIRPTKGRIESGAYTELQEEMVDNIREGINRIVIDGKDGTSMLKLTKGKVVFDDGTFSTLVKYNSQANDEDKVDIGRVLTGVLLHEIGHNMFLYLSFEFIERTYHFEDRKSIRIEVRKNGNNEPVMFEVNYDKKTDKELESEIEISGVAAAITSIIGIITILTPAFIIGLSSLVASSMLSRRNDSLNTLRATNRSEMAANYLPTLYGYSPEIIKFYVILSDMMGINPKDHKKKNSIFRIFRLFTKDHGGYDFVEISHVMKRQLEFELKNKNNTPAQLKMIKKQLDMINKSIDKLDRKRR